MEVNTTQLTEGQVFDTYPALCKALGCDVYGGYQKTKQLKEFERYFNYEKEGKKFIITEIYPEPISEEYRMAANAKYVGFIQNILLSYLSQQEEEIIYLTQQQLWTILGMVNNKYFLMRTPHKKEDLMNLSEDMTMFDINNFFNRSGAKFADIIKTALNSLQRRKLLIYEKPYRIGEVVSNEKFMQSGVVYRDATDNEKKYILRTENKLMHQFGFNDIYKLYASSKSVAYYDSLNKIFQKEKDWDHVYSCYKFIFDKDNIIEAINEDAEIKQMNELIIQVLNEQAENNYKKWGYTSDNAVLRMFDEDRPFFYYEGYQRRQQVLTEALIRR